MERRDFLKRAGIGAAGASAAVSGIGALESPAFADGHEIPCPFLDNYVASGQTAGRTLEDLLLHIRDGHTSAVSEPAREQLRTVLTGCAHGCAHLLPV